MNRRVMRLTSELVGNCGFALPVAGGAKPQFLQRSKNARKAEARSNFSGTASWHEVITRRPEVQVLLPQPENNSRTIGGAVIFLPEKK